ncbi:MAG TPA: glucose-1-phosphate adenylyltransferase [Pirellulales bacterium]|jgi:glucose-1-phosphate adenylyltransferase|nr:glucose-1-phosphate adenylyltransferase [Pirellulales bacterium]
MSNVITLVLGGGRGQRLYPLTKFRSKPAVPLAGKYRLIDIPLSNCINSGLNRIYVLTQFLSVSLHRHIRRTYAFDAFDGGFVELLAAQQTNEATDKWFQGTADAVRQHIRYIQQSGTDYVLILSGDQLYRMDYQEMIRTHRESKADVTIAALPVDRAEAAGFGIMRLDDSGAVVGFLEKPKTEQELAHVRTDPGWIDKRGINSRGRDCLASMGIYLFNRDRLVDVLTKTDYRDFGKEIFPASIRTHRVQVHLFDGYWEDIGTIKAFYQANIDLCRREPAFDISSALAPIYTRARFLAPSKIEGTTIRESLISDGCTIEDGAVIKNSIIGLRCHIGRNVTIRNSVVMGNDFYQTPDEIAADRAAGVPLLSIGEGSVIDGAIVDKNCRIGRNVRVINESGVQDTDDNGASMVRDGILVVPKEVTLPDGWRMTV